VLALRISGRADHVFRLIRLLAQARGDTTLGDLKKGDPSCLVLSLPKSRRS
jgi:hypothetical protein